MNQREKKALSISGGAFKIPFLLGVCVQALRGNTYDIIQGTSSGAIVAFGIATGRVEAMTGKVLTFSPKDVFRQNPNSIWGKFRAFLRFVRGEEYLFDQSKLLETLQSIIREEDFEKYKNNSASPDCYVGIAPKGELHTEYVNLKLFNYETACMAVLASCSIPNATKEVFVNGNYYVDGGSHEHIGSFWLLNQYAPVIDSLLCVYSRPSIEWLRKGYKSWHPKKPKWFSFNFAKDLLNSYEDAQLSNSIDEEIKTDKVAEDLAIRYTKIFAPNLLSENLYKATDQEKATWFNLGKEAYQKSLRNE